MNHMPSPWTLSSKQSGNFWAFIAAAAAAAAAKFHFVVCEWIKIFTEDFKLGEPRWWRSEWKWHFLLPGPIWNHKYISEKSSRINNWAISGEKPYNHRQTEETVSPQRDWQRRWERAGWAPTDSSRSARGIFQWSEGIPLRSVGSKPQAGLPSLQHQSLKSTQITSSWEKWQGVSLPGTESCRCREPFKGQMHKFSFAATYLGSGKRRAERTRDAWGEPGASDSGERTERRAAKFLVLSYPPYFGSHLAQADHPTLSGISLRGSNSPACRNYCPTLWSLSLSVEYRVTRLQLKESATESRSLVVSNKLPKARLGHTWYHQRWIQKEKNSGKYWMLPRQKSTWTSSWFVIFSLLYSFLTFLSCP